MDKIRCISNLAAPELEVGREYDLIHVSERELLCIILLPNGCKAYFSKKRFERVAEKEKTASADKNNLLHRLQSIHQIAVNIQIFIERNEKLDDAGEQWEMLKDDVSAADKMIENMSLSFPETKRKG
jgi:hypothetical protein